MVQAGVDMVAELLGVTLGPKGRNVVLQNKYGPPKIVNDGETVLKEVLFFLVHMLVLMLSIDSLLVCIICLLLINQHTGFRCFLKMENLIKVQF